MAFIAAQVGSAPMIGGKVHALTWWAREAGASEWLPGRLRQKIFKLP